MNDYQLTCPEHGLVALIAADNPPAMAIHGFDCGAALQVEDSGAHDPANY